MHDNLGVGGRGEVVALRLQLFPQRLEILDDAVVHQADTLIGHVRVGVQLGGRPMGRPASVCDADVSGERSRAQFVTQFLDLAHPLTQIDALGTLRNHRHPG